MRLLSCAAPTRRAALEPRVRLQHFQAWQGLDSGGQLGSRLVEGPINTIKHWKVSVLYPSTVSPRRAAVGVHPVEKGVGVQNLHCWQGLDPCGRVGGGFVPLSGFFCTKSLPLKTVSVHKGIQ